MVSGEHFDWDLDTVSPSDWIGILELQLILDGEKSPTNSTYIKWLMKNGYSGSLIGSDISKIKAVLSRPSQQNTKCENVCKIISENVSVRAQIKYFESFAYRALKFFFPSGDPLQNARRTIPRGLYQSNRYSFSKAGDVVQSAFLFYRNDIEDELLHGYGVLPNDTKSNVCRFKEFRKIKLPDREYQIFVGGFVFYHNNSFYLAGVSFETEPNIKEHELKASDIKKSHAVWYILDDGNDPKLLRGIKVTSLKFENDPAAAVLELTRVGNEASEDRWVDLSEAEGVSIGVVAGADAQRFGNTLREKLCDKFNMLIASRKI